MVEVPDQKRATLEPIICHWILPGSQIILDAWATYNMLDEMDMDLGIYQPDMVVHQQNVLNLDDDTVHTQLIENTWICAKRKLMCQFGMSRVCFASYLSEFMWCNQFHMLNGIIIFCILLTKYIVTIIVLIFDFFQC